MARCGISFTVGRGGGGHNGGGGLLPSCPAYGVSWNTGCSIDLSWSDPSEILLCSYFKLYGEVLVNHCLSAKPHKVVMGTKNEENHMSFLVQRD